MKVLPTLLVVTILVLLASACTSFKPEPPPDLPPQRPGDFEISFIEAGAPDESFATYEVSAAKASFTQSSRDVKNGKWEFQPETADLDALYSFVQKSQITRVTTTPEGEISDRFGYILKIYYDGHYFQAVDCRNYYIRPEADYNRFKDVVAEVRAFVGKGIENQKFEVTANVVLDAKAPRPDSLSVVLEEISLIGLRTDDQAGDTLEGSFTALQGTYQMTAFAKVAGRVWALSKKILLTAPTRVNLQLGNDGFVEIAESVEK